MKYYTVLCCVSLASPFTNMDEFSFYQLFSPFAVIKNIKVFRKEEQTKAFVQLLDEKSVTEIIDHFHNKHLNVGKMKVYASHKKYIAFDKSLKDIISNHHNYENENEQNWDYNHTGENIRRNSYQKNYLSNKQTNEPKVEGLENRKYYNYLYNSENLDERQTSQPYTRFSDCKKPLTTQCSLKIESKVSQETRASNTFDDVREECAESESNILRVNNIDSTVISSQTLMNLFGCFGNVKRLMVNLSLNFAVIEFESHEQAEFAFKFINNLLFFKNTLTISFVPNAEILNEAEKKPQKDVKIIKGHYKYFRYKKNLKIKVNKPSRLLHFTSLSPSVTPAILCKIISQVHEPAKILELAKKGTDSDMYLVEFKHLYQSLEVLSILHNKKIEGKLLKVSFSHTKTDNF